MNLIASVPSLCILFLIIMAFLFLMYICIKDSNSVANLRKTKIDNTKIDLVNDNVYTQVAQRATMLT